MDYDFSFRISGLTEDQVTALFDYIVTFVEECRGWVGGGFHPVAEEEVDDGETTER